MKVWLAAQCRRFAQWLDPQPDTLTAVQTVLARLRLELTDALHDRERDSVEHSRALAVVQAERLILHEELLDLKRTHAHCLPVPQDDLYAEALALAAAQDTQPAHVSGEFKRRLVYAALIKHFPTRPHRDVALAIEATRWR